MYCFRATYGSLDLLLWFFGDSFIWVKFWFGLVYIIKGWTKFKTVDTFITKIEINLNAQL